MRVRCVVLGGLLVAGLALVGSPSTAAPVAAGDGRAPLPATLPLPDGFQPEGIAIGPGPVGYFGSRANGDIYRIDLVSGQGSVLSPGPGTPSLGMKTDALGRLFVAGGSGGDGRVLDTRSGEVLARYRFATGTSFVNDVVLAGGAAYFTDSANPYLYKLPLRWHRGHGGLPGQADVVRVPLTGDLVMGAGINANGIETAPDGRALLVVQSNTGRLYRVDPASGVTREVDLGGYQLTNGDGLLRDGRTLYVVQNRLNVLAVLALDAAGSTGRLVEQVTDARFDVPTTVARFGHRLYLPNARFTTQPTPTTPYNVVAIARPQAP